jgi:hypothetical protein
MKSFIILVCISLYFTTSSLAGNVDSPSDRKKNMVNINCTGLVALNSSNLRQFSINYKINFDGKLTKIEKYDNDENIFSNLLEKSCYLKDNIISCKHKDDNFLNKEIVLNWTMSINRTDGSYLEIYDFEDTRNNKKNKTIYKGSCKNVDKVEKLF